MTHTCALRSALVAVALALASCTTGAPGTRVDAPPLPTTSSESGAPALPKRAYLRDACRLPPQWVQRIHRGWAPGNIRDHDLVLVPHPPNYMGTFINTSHSGPYAFLQDVPLVLYGPGFIKTSGRIALDREVTIADLAPTFAELVGFEWPRRPSTALSEVLVEDAARPALIVTMVVDGAGWNVLDRWPDTWPNLRALIREGVNVDGAIVGSSPSITPATHTTLSTGTFPRYHGVTAIAVRADDGSIVGSFSETAGNPGAAAMDPTITLRKTTIADLWDRARGNEPLIGMLAAGNLQLGMIGHGAALRGGDKDIAAILSGDTWSTNPEFYSLPDYVNDEVPGPEQDVREVDLADGKADGLWRGHDIAPVDASPAFAPWQNRVVQAILEREGFGADDVTDLFYLNYKAPDKAGHKWNMIGIEQADVLRSVDEAIGDMKLWLDEQVGSDRYVLVVTADHGQTPLEAGGWPISRPEILDDIRARFDRVDDDRGIIEQTSASSFFSRIDEMRANGVTAEQVASFLSRYTIAENVPEGEDLPDGFERRADDLIFDAVFPGRYLPRIMACTQTETGG